MLKHPLPGALRRRTGFVLMLALMASGCYAVRAAQSQAATLASEAKPIAINLKVFENGVDLITQHVGPAGAAGWDVITDSSGSFMIRDTERAVNCTARLPSPGRSAPTGESFEGTIVISCKLSHAEQVFASPTLLVRDSVPSSIEVADPQNGANYRLQFTATTTDAGIAAARIAVDAARANAAAGKFRLRLERAKPAQAAPAQ